MLILDNRNTNPYFNIAAEEYLLKEFGEDIFMLYINEPSIVAGKHQNMMAEVNYRFVTENNIPVIRRISGGGTVYHDLGNLNFLFISNSKAGNQIDFKRYTQPIIDVLLDLGIDAKLEGKNDIRVGGIKISGNAEHVFKNRVLHHGTLLVSSDLNNLSQALKVQEGKYTDNAVKSIRSKVTNLNAIDARIQIKPLKELIFKKVRESCSQNFDNYELSDTDKTKIEALVTEKYQTWEWNFGYSPKYSFKNSFENYSIYLEVEEEEIKKAELIIKGESSETLNEKLKGVKHIFKEVHTFLKNNSISGLSSWDFF